MSWLSIPLSNPFKSLNSSPDDDRIQHSHQFYSISTISPHNGVKDDFSAIGESITRQLRGVAAFLAPPPLAGDSNPDGVIDGDKSTAFAGIRSDLAEIGGCFKNSLSVLSCNSTVAGISKLASNFLQLSDGDDDDGGDGYGDDGGGDGEGDDVGIKDEVVEFANRISNRRELWIDFPLPLDNKEVHLSDTQFEHVSVIEQLVPELADLRSRLTGDMSDNHFWMIYFILLLPRLNDDDFELLSTPEIVEARELLLQMLQNKKGTEIDSENTESPIVERNQSEERVVCENSATSTSVNQESEAAKKPIEEDADKIASSGIGTSRTLCSEETGDNSNIRTVNDEHERDDNWSEGEKQDVITRTFQGGSKQFQSEDDVSFSDLEIEDDDNYLPSKQTCSGTAHATRPPSSMEGSSDWVQLNKNVANKGSQLRGQSRSRDRDSEGYESSDWLTVDFDP